MKITQCGALSYPFEKMINILDLEIDIEQLKNDFRNENSDFFKAYKKGMDISDFAVDSALFNKAKSGDKIAIRDLLKRRKVFAAQKNRDSK